MVGFVASFAVVLAGLFQVGASREQAASGLLVLSLTVGLSTIALSWRHRLPISIAWSTPGAAMHVEGHDSVLVRWKQKQRGAVDTAPLKMMLGINLLGSSGLLW